MGESAIFGKIWLIFRVLRDPGAINNSYLNQKTKVLTFYIIIDITIMTL